ncbi:MAG: hypothetical protein NVS9B15_25350 [Acidobacteriaceae bacterium]
MANGASYSNALWWRQLGAHPAATHFIYDLQFYMKSPSLAQGLEFDVNQSLNGKKYIFGTECDLRNGNVWRVYDSTKSAWLSTSIHCGTPSAYAWHHVLLEFARVNGQVHFVSVSMNGTKSYINRTYAPRDSSAKELNVAFQMDENGSGTGYSTYLDQVKLTYW